MVQTGDADLGFGSLAAGLRDMIRPRHCTQAIVRDIAAPETPAQLLAGLEAVISSDRRLALDPDKLLTAVWTSGAPRYFEAGGSRISYQDFAMAMVEKLEAPKHGRARIAVGYRNPVAVPLCEGRRSVSAAPGPCAGAKTMAERAAEMRQVAKAPGQRDIRDRTLAMRRIAQVLRHHFQTLSGHPLAR